MTRGIGECTSWKALNELRRLVDQLLLERPEMFAGNTYSISCQRCKYILVPGIADRCPECGARIDRVRLLIEQYGLWREFVLPNRRGLHQIVDFIVGGTRTVPLLFPAILVLAVPVTILGYGERFRIDDLIWVTIVLLGGAVALLPWGFLLRKWLAAEVSAELRKRRLELIRAIDSIRAE